jgi:hypothetical protein
VFALSQLIIITIINPHQTYLKAASDLSREMLKLTHKYTNFKLDQTEVESIRNANASYLAAVWNSGCLFREKRRRKGFKVAQYINELASLGFSPKDQGERLLSLVENIAEVEKLDSNLKIQYIDTSEEKNWKVGSSRTKDGKRGGLYNDK